MEICGHGAVGIMKADQLYLSYWKYTINMHRFADETALSFFFSPVHLWLSSETLARQSEKREIDDKIRKPHKNGKV